MGDLRQYLPKDEIPNDLKEIVNILLEIRQHLDEFELLGNKRDQLAATSLLRSGTVKLAKALKNKKYQAASETELLKKCKKEAKRLLDRVDGEESQVP